MSQIVDAYWINRHTQNPIEKASQNRILPDGCIDLIYRGDTHSRRDSRAGLFASPLIQEAMLINPDSTIWYVGVRFRPAMSRIVLPIHPAALLNHDLPATEIDAGFSRLNEQLSSCACPDKAIHILRHAVEGRLRLNCARAAPNRITAAIKFLSQSPPSNGIKAVSRSVGLSERSLHREIHHWTGLAPKVLSRILRMQSSINSLRTGKLSLAEIAIDKGYADQAHMTREFRRLTGLTPSDYSK